MKLLIYTDSEIMGGAEQTTGGLLESFAPHVDVTLVGTSRPIVEALARRRPGVPFAIVPPIRHKLDFARMLAFVRPLRGARPDIVQINCATPWTCKHETLIAALAPGVRTVLIEHLPVEPDGEWIRFVKRTLVRGVDAHVAVGAAAAREVERQIGLRTGSLRVIESAVPSSRSSAPTATGHGR